MTVTLAIVYLCLCFYLFVLHTAGLAGQFGDSIHFKRKKAVSLKGSELNEITPFFGARKIKKLSAYLHHESFVNQAYIEQPSVVSYFIIHIISNIFRTEFTTPSVTDTISSKEP